MRDVATVLVALGAVPAWLFVIGYSIRTHGGWRDSAEGRHLMSFTLVVALFLSLALTARVLGHPVWLTFVAVVLYGCVAYLLWRRFYLMMRATRR